MAESQTPADKLKEIEPRLKYGAKAEIARRLEINKHNVQTAFRGMAGKDLTLIVWRAAKKLPTKYLARQKKSGADSAQ